MDKEKNLKNKSKKRIFIGISSVVAITLCGSIIWSAVDSNGKINEMIEQTYLKAEKVTKNKDNLKEQQPEFDLDQTKITQLPGMLAAIGCGYTEENLAQYRTMSPTGPVIEEEDKKNEENIVDQFYLFGNEDGVSEKPEYGGDIDEEPKISYESTTLEGKKAWRAKYTFKGEVKISEYFEEPYVITNLGEFPTPEEYASYAKDKAFESIKDQYQKDYEIWNKWKDYFRKRAEWFSGILNAGYLNAEKLNLPYDEMDQDYLDFWVKMACKLFEGIVGDSKEQLYTLLSGIIMTPDGEIRTDIPNLFNAGLTGTIDDVRDPETGEIIEGSGGSTGGGPGGNPGGDAGGGDAGGGDPGGEGNPGGSDEDDGTSNSAKDYETAGDGKDTVGPKITSVTVSAPPAGTYSKGQKIQVNVKFDKNVYGTIEGSTVDKDSAPKLTLRIAPILKDGQVGIDGWSKEEEREMQFESSGGSNISYSYIVKENDNGKLALAGDTYNGVVYNKSGIPTIVKGIPSLSGADKVIMDNKAPVVEKIETVSNEAEYTTGKEVKIKVTFDESVYTARNRVPIIKETAPVFKASFGSGQPKVFTFDSYSEKDKTITYKYVITAEDIGKLKIDVNNVFDGTRPICDASGTSEKIIKGTKLTGKEIIANPQVNRIDLDKDEIILDLKDATEAKEISTILRATLVGFAEGTQIRWETDKKEVAIVEENGKVVAKSVGQATIFAKVYNGNNAEAEAKCKVIVKDTTKGETLVNVEKKEIELDLNGKKEETLTGKVVQIDSTGKVTQTDQKITYTSREEAIAKVENGKVIGVKTGETTIIAKAEDGTEAEIKVIVKNSSTTEIEPTAIVSELTKVVVDPSKTKTFNLNCTLEPSNCNKRTKITYTSSDENVATVDTNGKVTVKNIGTTVIMATTENGKRTYITVNVINTATHEDLNGAQTGDYNKDKVVDSTDLLTMLRHIAASKSTDISKKHQTWIILDDRYYLLDVNNDGVIDTTDALALQRHIATTKSEDIANKHSDWILK